MSDDAAEAWDRYWQGRGDEQAGAFTGIEHDVELQTFWQTTLSDGQLGSPFLDLACGAGTVLQTAHSLGYSDLTGADVSKSALKVLQARFRDIKTVITDASHTPFSDAAFATITSQFGFEYANPLKTASEVARLLRRGGQFIAVCHHSGGAISREVQGHLAFSEAIHASGFIKCSKALFVAESARDKVAATDAVKALIPARDILTQLAHDKKSGFAKHLLAGSAQMWERRQNYEIEDIFKWFDAMEVERAAYGMRMQDMLDAAMTELEAHAVLDVFRQSGLDVSPLAPFSLGGVEAAWILKAQRRA